MSAAIAAVIAAAITGMCGIIAQIVISKRSKDDLISNMDKQIAVKDSDLKGEIAVIKFEIVELRKSQDKHNQMIERMYTAEKDIATIKQDMKVANHRIEDLEKITVK
jgi:hypothetical protein